MPDLSGQHFVVTGANTGIGRSIATELVRRGANVTVATRSRAKTEPVLAEIRAETGRAPDYVELDLADFASVRRAADELRTRAPIDVLVNNAGLAGQRGLTADGFELAFGTNHLGHYLLTRLLVDRIRARVVMVSSDSHYQAKGIDWQVVREPTHTITGLREYEVSKLANVLFAKELARRTPALHTYAVNPGQVATDVWRRIPAPVRWAMKRFMITPDQGAQSSLRCATDPDVAGDTGRYYGRSGREKRPSPLADDVALAAELWQRSAAWTGLAA